MRFTFLLYFLTLLSLSHLHWCNRSCGCHGASFSLEWLHAHEAVTPGWHREKCDVKDNVSGWWGRLVQSCCGRTWIVGYNLQVSVESNPPHPFSLFDFLAFSTDTVCRDLGKTQTHAGLLCWLKSHSLPLKSALKPAIIASDADILMWILRNNTLEIIQWIVTIIFPYN